jgi:predicted esterase
MNKFLLGTVLIFVTCSGLLHAGEPMTTNNEVEGVPYITITPTTVADTKRMGLVLVFHGKGGKAEPMMKGVNKSLSQYAPGIPFVVIGVQNDRKPLWEDWGSTAIEIAAKITEKALEQDPRIDPRRVYTYGFSAGAWMAGSLAAARPKLFAAAMPFGMGIGDEYVVSDKNKPIPPMYLGVGSEDPHRYYGDLSAINLRACNAQFIYRYMPGLGHTAQHKEVNEDSFRWLITQRNEFIPPSKTEIELLKTVAKPKAQEPLTAKNIELAAEIGGTIAGSALIPVINGKDVELAHVAIRAAAQTWCGGDTYKAIARRLKDKDATLRDAAVKTLGVWANWRVPLAQDALIAAAKSGTPAERVVAFQALKVALALQIPANANPQDPALAHVAVAALSDRDADVRAAAYAAIKVAQVADYDPAVDNAQQAKAIAAWRAWAENLQPKDVKRGK